MSGIREEREAPRANASDDLDDEHGEAEPESPDQAASVVNPAMRMSATHGAMLGDATLSEHAPNAVLAGSYERTLNRVREVRIPVRCRANSASDHGEGTLACDILRRRLHKTLTTKGLQ